MSDEDQEHKDDDENNELALVTTEDLLTELHRRFDHTVFGGLLVASNPDGDPKNGFLRVYRRWKGNPTACTGLAFEVASSITNLLFKEQQDESE